MRLPLRGECTEGNRTVGTHPGGRAARERTEGNRTVGARYWERTHGNAPLGTRCGERTTWERTVRRILFAGFEALCVFGYLELVYHLLNLTIHKDRQVVG